MKDLPPDMNKEMDEQGSGDSLEDAFHEMEMLYKSRCVDVPLTSNVRVVEVDKKDGEEEDDSPADE